MPRVEYAGAIYHIRVRMAGQACDEGRPLEPTACLFRDDAERIRFIEQLGEGVEAYGMRLYACCHRYKAKPVEGDRYHLGLSRYVHLNPVRVAATKALPVEEQIRILLEYRWSSYRVPTPHCQY